MRIKRYNLGDTPTTFEEYKEHIRNNPYSPELESVWREYNYGKIFDSDSEMVKTSVGFNMRDSAYEFTRVPNSHSISYPTVGSANVIVQAQRLPEIVSRQPRMIGTDPTTMEGVNYLYSVNPWIPDEATEVEVKTWEDLYLYVPSSGNYVYFSSCVGKYSGSGFPHPTVGRYNNRLSETGNNNIWYQQNRLIAIPLKANRTYYCSAVYPVVNEYDENVGHFNKGVTTVSTSSPYAPTYADVYGSGKVVGQWFRTEPSFTIPTTNRSTRVTVSTSNRYSIKISSATNTYAANTHRLSDLISANNKDTYETYMLIGESGSYYIQQGSNYGVPIGGGYNDPISSGRLLTSFVTPALYSFKTSRNTLEGSWLYLNCCKYTADGTTFSALPRVWEV